MEVSKVKELSTAAPAVRSPQPQPAVKPQVAEPGDGTIPPEPDRGLKPASRHIPGKSLLAVA